MSYIKAKTYIELAPAPTSMVFVSSFTVTANEDGSYVITAPLDEREQAAWNTYQKYYDDFSVYGPDFNDTPPLGSGTGYDSSLLVKKTTDKGCGCYVDTATGKVYYNGMILPDGGMTDIEDHGAFIKWVLEDTDGRGECTVSTITPCDSHLPIYTKNL